MRLYVIFLIVRIFREIQHLRLQASGDTMRELVLPVAWLIGGHRHVGRGDFGFGGDHLDDTARRLAIQDKIIKKVTGRHGPTFKRLRSHSLYLETLSIKAIITF